MSPGVTTRTRRTEVASLGGSSPSGMRTIPPTVSDPSGVDLPHQRQAVGQAGGSPSGPSGTSGGTSGRSGAGGGTSAGSGTAWPNVGDVAGSGRSSVVIVISFQRFP